MTNSIRNRFYLYVLYAALAIMFWFFDLEILAWIFAALVILPLIIGGLILIWKSFPSPSVGRPDKDD